MAQGAEDEGPLVGGVVVPWILAATVVAEALAAEQAWVPWYCHEEEGRAGAGEARGPLDRGPRVPCLPSLGDQQNGGTVLETFLYSGTQS